MAKETNYTPQEKKIIKKNVLEFRPGFLWI